MKYQKLLIFILLKLCLVQTVFAQTTQDSTRLRILDLENSGDPIGKYVTEVLRLAIKHSGVAYTLEKIPAVSTPQVRLIEDLSHNRGVLDLIWTMTSDERETQLLPIRIPIDKGLMGWRIAFINPEMAVRMKAIKSMQDLSALKAGQDYFWPDTQILRHNKLPVVTAAADALPLMLSQRRFDYYPRSIIEIWNEQSNQPKLNREIDTSIILYYPTALYFFVAPSQKQLAEDLRRGLELSISNGSFEQLFTQYCRPFVVRANIKNRRIFVLENPLIQPSSLPLQRPKLWFSP